MRATTNRAGEPRGSEQLVRILTNFGFPDRWTCSGRPGTAQVLSSYSELRPRIANADLLLINGDPDLTFRLCALFLTQPRRRRPFVSVVLVLRAPASDVRSRLKHSVRRLLLREVWHFDIRLSGRDTRTRLEPK